VKVDLGSPLAIRTNLCYFLYRQNLSQKWLFGVCAAKPPHTPPIPLNFEMTCSQSHQVEQIEVLQETRTFVSFPPNKYPLDIFCVLIMDIQSILVPLDIEME